MKTWRMPTLGEPLARRPHAEGLGRVAAGGEEVDLRSRARVTSRADADDRAPVGRERLNLGSADGLGEERVVADLEVAVVPSGIQMLVQVAEHLIADCHRHHHRCSCHTFR